MFISISILLAMSLFYSYVAIGLLTYHIPSTLFHFSGCSYRAVPCSHTLIDLQLQHAYVRTMHIRYIYFSFPKYSRIHFRYLPITSDSYLMMAERTTSWDFDNSDDCGDHDKQPSPSFFGSSPERSDNSWDSFKRQKPLLSPTCKSL